MKKAFTLLELLIVIAIIGVLAAIVMASLNSARSKAKDSAIRSDIDSIKKQIEIYASSNPYVEGDRADQSPIVYSSYVLNPFQCHGGANGIFGDPVVVKAITHIASQMSTPVVFCATSVFNQDWAFAIQDNGSAINLSYCFSKNNIGIKSPIDNPPIALQDPYGTGFFYNCR